MPRRPRESTGGIAYHVLNRGAGRRVIFEGAADYDAFERVLTETHDRLGCRILSYCLMPNHFHFLLWPHQDGESLRPIGRPREGGPQQERLPTPFPESIDQLQPVRA